MFEKSLSCVNNLRLQDGRPIVAGHSIYVVDLQDGGGWDWTTGEPPKTNAAYYLRFCKSFSRMGGAMHYLQCDNAAFVHHLDRMLALRMTPERFRPITGAYPELRIAVAGDFCLDRYLEIDPARSGDLDRDGPAGPQRRQRARPAGAAGTILNNLVALGVGQIFPSASAARTARATSCGRRWRRSTASGSTTFSRRRSTHVHLLQTARRWSGAGLRAS